MTRSVPWSRRTPCRPVGAAALLALALALVLSGCGGSESPRSAPSASATPTTAATSTTPAAPPAPPQVGSCHSLDLPAATAPVDTSAPVPCSQAHTTVTIAVGRLDQVVDGHLLAVDSAAVRASVAKACPPTLARYVGGDRTTQRLSRLQVLPFSPSLEQADAGASWYRCDLVALRTEGQLLPLTGRMRGALAKPGALDRYGTCGTSAPGSPGFGRVACSEAHRWRAVRDLAITGAGRYLDKAAGDRGDAACKAIAQQRSQGALKFSWSFEWPTKAQWDSGQRWGLCWLPGA